jgi:hypothetical protein
LFGVAGRLDLFGVAGLWIEMARGREVSTALVLGVFVRVRSLGSLSSVTLLSQGLAIIQRSIQLQPQLGFPGSVKVGVTVLPDFLHCTRLIRKKNWQTIDKRRQYIEHITTKVASSK